MYRIDTGGNPTFDAVMAGLDVLRRNDVAFNVLTTVHAANQGHGLEVYRFLRDEAGARFLQFIPVVERIGSPDRPRVTERSASADGYGRFMIEVFDEWVRRDVGTVFVQLFDVALAAWTGRPPGLCVFAETCGGAPALEHTGDLYSCDHFVEPDHLLGNLADGPIARLLDSPQQRAFGAAKRSTLPDQCLACEVRFVCNGGCPKDRFATTDDGRPGLNHLCRGYRRFFGHIQGPMDFMAGELARRRAPANVMAHMAGTTRSEG